MHLRLFAILLTVMLVALLGAASPIPAGRELKQAKIKRAPTPVEVAPRHQPSDHWKREAEPAPVEVAPRHKPSDHWKREPEPAPAEVAPRHKPSDRWKA
ncbi:hypothetical protein JAAARDRAFT_33244 [Jaapia argillacea MUCL 33604]|uniref:Uncharacterized protein n=1 Tax=Jaapia argillacea MUCL 33604 TaxID=933084 RepID=A0A067Q849_9AGAM|nr:hypothetical protein JAAARDRAFT_33244 [Jaapia argillacea MUCL 33604]